MAASKLVFHQDLVSMIQPSYLILWGLIRVAVILPLIFFLSQNIGLDGEDIYLGFKNNKNLFLFTFWGTFIFTILGVILYPFFLKSASFTLIFYLTNFPIFILYAVSNAFVEEVFFRGIGLEMFTRKYGFWFANFFQATAFALIHVFNPMSSNLWLFVGLTFFLGLAWGYMTKKYKSLLPAIVTHVIADIFVAISIF
ncbi:MAG: CPBP family intramembrane glutamic endopeptidase [bacterium]